MIEFDTRKLKKRGGPRAIAQALLITRHEFNKSPKCGRDALLDEAIHFGADLIIIGSHHPSLRLLGSTLLDCLALAGQRFDAPRAES